MGERTKEFERYPKIKQAYIRAFERMIEERKRLGLPTEWKTGEDVFEWYMKE